MTRNMKSRPTAMLGALARPRHWLAACVLLGGLQLACTPGVAQTYDLVIVSGRVMDPETVHDPEVNITGPVDASNSGLLVNETAKDGRQGWSVTRSNVAQMNQVLNLLDEDGSKARAMRCAAEPRRSRSRSVAAPGQKPIRWMSCRSHRRKSAPPCRRPRTGTPMSWRMSTTPMASAWRSRTG